MNTNNNKFASLVSLDCDPMGPGVKNGRCRDAYVNGYFGAPCTELCEATQNKLVLNDVEATTMLLRYAILTLHESSVKSLRRRRRSPTSLPSVVSSR